MALQLKIGLDAINSYKRLAYTPWHAIAEFVDNSTQSYFNNKKRLDQSYKKSGGRLNVSVVYDKSDDGILRVVDNSIGMSYQELEHALHIGLPPKDTSGRSKYGMGMKTAASWIGNRWQIRTKKLGETVEHKVSVDVEELGSGQSPELPYEQSEGLDVDEHYTIIEIRRHNRTFHGRTLGKIKDYLRSMYRMDFRRGLLELEWNHELLEWDDFPMLCDSEGQEYKRDFSFEIDGEPVHGWVGILEKGGRPNAGFSIIHCGRVVRGWPEAWRPSSLYGQLQGTNDLVNQRLVGEIHLDPFEVSHTKDDILWIGNEEEEVEQKLRECCEDYRDVARSYRKGRDDERGPSQAEVDVAMDEFRRELESGEMADRLNIDDAVPPPEVIDASIERVLKKADGKEPSFIATIGSLIIRIYIDLELSSFDPYVVMDSAKDDAVSVLVNKHHPHWKQIKGSDGVLNYLRHCVYDGLAEWKARKKTGSIDSDTIKMLKDKFLRVPMEIEQHVNSPDAKYD